jgi:hypothetical protein
LEFRSGAFASEPVGIEAKGLQVGGEFTEGMQGFVESMGQGESGLPLREGQGMPARDERKQATPIFPGESVHASKAEKGPG